MSDLELPRILLVEDDPIIRDMVEAALRGAGFEVALAESGEQGLALLDGPGAFRGVVTDIDLGGPVDGWALARHARDLDTDISIVYMTGASASQWLIQGVPLSILVSKPFAEGQIVAAISGLLNGPSTAAAG